MQLTREFEITLRNRLNEPLNNIQIVIGPRQVGKTTGVRKIFDEYGGHKHFATADSPVPLSAEWLEAQWERARRPGSPSLLVVDEIQKVSGWPEISKALFDRDRAKKEIKVVFLGSASLSIQQGLISALAGRFELIHAPHWSPAECKKAFSWDLDLFLRYGGYPGAAEYAGDPSRWQAYVRDSIIEPVLGRDIAGIVRIDKPALFRQVFRLAVLNPSRTISYQKLLGQLQDKGNAATIKNYLELLEGAFLIKKLEKFSGSALSISKSSPKLVPLAPALSNAMLDDLGRSEDPEWQGAIFEAAAGAQLLKLPGTLFYWSEGNYEVDFVRVADKEIIAYEVKSGLSHKAKSLEVFRRKYPRAKIEIIDRDNFKEIVNG